MDISRPAKVGAMTVALVAAGYGAYRFISPSAGTDGGYSVYSYLPDVTGVAPRSRVMISGIPVGVVDRISLDHGKARVDVRMNPNVALYTDAAIGKKATSLIGENFIILTPGTEGRPRIPDHGEITHYIEEPSLESLQSQVKDILVDVKAVTNSLSKSVGSDDGQKQMADILKNLAEVTEQLNATVKENRAGIQETITTVNHITQASRPEIAAILENVRQVTDDVKKMTAANETPAGKPGELRSTVERVNRASASLESALQHADNIAAKIDRGEGTVGRLVKDDALINEVQGVAEGVNEFVGGLNRVQTIVGLRTDYNFLANTIKSYVELRLQPTEDKYYLIQLVNDPRGKTNFLQRDVDTTNTNQPPHYREVVTETTNALRFSFQFAKRLGPITGRFGIMESTGGLGLDLHLLGDRLELRQDLFGFGEELSPRWRIALEYEFIRKLWLLGGVDDIMNDDRRDYFVGLQLRFNDRDLRLIVPFAGGAL
jgi:phospholipid/cholesterol/gamma-HCH transport system substrate-binding protein